MVKYILILTSLILFSCGSRKVTIDKNYLKKDSITQIDTKIVKKEVSKTKIENNILIDEFIITPLDTTKEIVINGNTYKNVVLRHKKTKDSSLYNNTKIASKNEQKQVKTVVVELKKEFKKDIDKKANYWIYLWLLILPLIYILYKLLIKNFL